MTFQEIPWPKSASVLIGSFQMAQNLDVTQDCEKCKITKMGDFTKFFKSWKYHTKQCHKLLHFLCKRKLYVSMCKSLLIQFFFQFLTHPHQYVRPFIGLSVKIYRYIFTELEHNHLQVIQDFRTQFTFNWVRPLTMLRIFFSTFLLPHTR